MHKGLQEDEPLFFVDRGGDATASLLFPPEQLLAVRNAAGDVAYEEGRDFRFDAAAGLVILTAQSRIPRTTLAELYPCPARDASTFMFKRGAPDIHLLFDEAGLFHRRQVRARYTHGYGELLAAIPPLRAGDLPRTRRRLRAGERLTIASTGDSITAGYNASGFLGLPPHQPPYVDLLVAGLTETYRSPIVLHNLASAGWTSDNGLADVERLGEARPDLAIVAYGMNDSGYAEPAAFAANVAGIVAEVRREAPDAEFVLVSPMLPNPEWHYPVMDRFAGYRDALASRCGAGVALADLTTVWERLLERKSVYDLTGNGVNHPNDFGHRVYAQVVRAVIG